MNQQKKKTMEEIMSSLKWKDDVHNGERVKMTSFGCPHFQIVYSDRCNSNGFYSGAILFCRNQLLFRYEDKNLDNLLSRMFGQFEYWADGFCKELCYEDD